jgi:hypothetical protein
MHIELLWRSRSWSFKNRGVGVGAFVYRLHSRGGNSPSIQNMHQSVPRKIFKFRLSATQAFHFVIYQTGYYVNEHEEIAYFRYQDYYRICPFTT